MKTVKILDLKSGKITEIPEAELAPTMVFARVSEKDGSYQDVWVEHSQIKSGDLKHGPFEGEIREKIILIQDALQEVYPQTYEFWEDGFRRDTNPDKEIAVWINICFNYLRATEIHNEIEEKKDIFTILIGCSCSPDYPSALQTVNLKVLSSFDAELIAKKYFGVK